MLLAGSLMFFFRLPSIFDPFIGRLSDRMDLRFYAVMAPATIAMAMSLLGATSSYRGVCIYLFIAGIGSAVYHVLGPSMIARTSGRYIGRGMGFWTAGSEMAWTVGPLLAVGAVSLWGFEKIYPVMIVGLSSSLFLYINLKDKVTISEQQPIVSIREAWSVLRRIMLPVIGILFARTFMVATLDAFLPTYIVASGKSLWIGGASMAVLQVSGMVGAFLSGTISDRVGRQTVFLVAMPISCISMLGFVKAPGWMQFPLLILLGSSTFAVTPLILAIVQDHSKNFRGIANGLYMGLNSLFTAVVTVFMGLLADLLGLREVFALTAILGFIGVIMIFFIPKSQRFGLRK